MKTGNVLIGSVSASSKPNTLGDIYVFGYYLPPDKGNGYYMTVKRLGGKRETLLTTQIFPHYPTTANLYDAALKAASAAGVIPKYSGKSNPIKFWEKNGGLKKNITFSKFLKPKSSFAKSHRGEGRVTTI